MERVLKVLVSAYACEPGGGEPGVGWNWVKQISRKHKVWVITRANNKEIIDSSNDREIIDNVTFVYIDLPKWMQKVKKVGGTLTLYWYYYIWQLKAYFVAKSLHKRIKFDVAHHVTFVNDWLPSFISLLNVPFIWGPVGGSTHVFPLKFWRRLSIRDLLYEVVRYLIQKYGRWFDPFVFLTRKRSWKIIAYTREAQLGFPRSVQQKVVVIPHIGIDRKLILRYQQNTNNNSNLSNINRFVIYSTGRLVHWKGYDLLVEALGYVVKEYENVRLIIGGKGPAERKLRALVHKLGLEGYVSFIGFLPYTKVLEQIANSDVFCLPTLRDGPPVALLEAMALGTPVICLDLYGAGELVPDEAGIKIKVTNPQEVVKNLAEALLHLAKDRFYRVKLGTAAAEYVAITHTWEKIGAKILSLYEELNQKTNFEIAAPTKP